MTLCICKYKCRSKGRRPAVNNVEEIVNNQNCSYSSEDPQATTDENFCGVITAWTEEGTSGNDDYSVLNIRTIYDTNGLETKKLVNIGLGEDAIVNLNILVDSASSVSFLRQNVLDELKLRNPQLKIHQADKKIVKYIAALPMIQLISSGKSKSGYNPMVRILNKLLFLLPLDTRGTFEEMITYPELEHK